MCAIRPVQAPAQGMAAVIWPQEVVVVRVASQDDGVSGLDGKVHVSITQASTFLQKQV